MAGAPMNNDLFKVFIVSAITGAGVSAIFLLSFALLEAVAKWL